MSDGFKITFPIRGYLKKMIARTTSVDPLVISMRGCVYSSILYTSLDKKFIQVTDRKRDVFNDELQISFPEKYSRENRIYYDYKTLTFIDNSFKAIFNDKFLLYMEDNCQNKGDIQHYIAKFMQNYDLTMDDINPESLTKLFHRKRKSGKISNKHNLRTKTKTEETPVIIEPKISQTTLQL